MLAWMRRPLLLAAAALVLLVVVVARGESPVPTDMVDPPGVDLPGVSVGISAPSNPQPPSSGDSTLFYVIIGSLVGLLVLTAVVLAIRAALQRQRVVRTGVRYQGDVPAEPASGNVALERAVGQARELLARPGGAPGDAVIAAWQALERATQGRRPHQTATEFTAGLPADAQALAELRSLYQRARFSTVPTTDDDVSQARDALDRILVTLR